MQEAAASIARTALTGPRTPASGGGGGAPGSYARMVESTTEAKAGPWRPYLEAYVRRFDRGLGYDDLLEIVDGVYDKQAFVFSNNFITTIGGTDNAVAVWRYLAAPVKQIDLQIEGIEARYLPSASSSAAGGGGQASVAVLQQQLEAGRASGKVELVLMSEQRWHLPTLLVLVRAVFGPVLSVRVTTKLSIDLSTGRVLDQTDRVDNWLQLPWPIRLMLGATVPLATTIYLP